jgi:hypothetical protein
MSSKKPIPVDVAAAGLENMDPNDLGTTPMSYFSKKGLTFYIGNIKRMKTVQDVKAQRDVTLTDEQRMGIARIRAAQRIGEIADSRRLPASESGKGKGKGGGKGIKGFAKAQGKSPALVHNYIALHRDPEVVETVIRNALASGKTPSIDAAIMAVRKADGRQKKLPRHEKGATRELSEIVKLSMLAAEDLIGNAPPLARQWAKIDEVSRKTFLQKLTMVSGCIVILRKTNSDLGKKAKAA